MAAPAIQETTIVTALLTVAGLLLLAAACTVALALLPTGTVRRARQPKHRRRED